MKLPYRILLTAVCLPFLFAACSLTSLVREESRLEQVRVYLADGSVIEGKARLPDLCKAIEEKRIESFEFDIIAKPVLRKTVRQSN